MERTETSRIEERKLGQQESVLGDTKTQSAREVQKRPLQAEVPCCCPGCFSFDF